MIEQDTLERLKRAIGPAPVAVEPLRASAVRALGPAALSLVLMIGVVALLGRRADVTADAFLGYAAFSALQVACGAWLVVVCLRLGIPGRSPAPLLILGSAAVALGAHFIASWAAVSHLATAPPVAEAWRIGLACLGAVTALSIAPAAWVAVLYRRGLAMHPGRAFGLAGLAGGLGAEAAWRLHCEYSAWSHVLAWHDGAVLLAVAATVVASCLVTGFEERGGG